MIQFELPANIESQLRAAIGDLDAAAKEAALVELYRQERLSHGEFADALGVSRYDADGILKRHGVVEDLATRAEIEAQVSAVRKLIGG